MNGSEERAAKRVKVEDDNDAATLSSSAASTSTAVASTSNAAATATSSASVKQEPATSATNGPSSNTSALKKEEEKQYDDEDRLYEDYASNAEVVSPSGDLYLDTVSCSGHAYNGCFMSHYIAYTVLYATDQPQRPRFRFRTFVFSLPVKYQHLCLPRVRQILSREREEFACVCSFDT